MSSNGWAILTARGSGVKFLTESQTSQAARVLVITDTPSLVRMVKIFKLPSTGDQRLGFHEPEFGPGEKSSLEGSSPAAATFPSPKRRGECQRCRGDARREYGASEEEIQTEETQKTTWTGRRQSASCRRHFCKDVQGRRWEAGCSRLGTWKSAK
ncbi:UNVERIFIED_CONTAM: hypothetical protein HHA_216420 [Hammondia hammondi]|eukprot:XP_008886381.1 hypothetical protein HHA_216420 [Hammondia hammondi]